MAQIKMVGVQFTDEQRAYMVEVYIETKNLQETKRKFQRRYRNRNAPSLRTIKRNYFKYRGYGTSHNRNKGNSGRPRSARTPHNIALVQNEIQRNPHVSSRRNQVPVTQSTFNRITRQLHLHPYRIHMQQALEPGDPQRRLAFCQWLQGRPNRFLATTIISDEAAFHINGRVNTWNMHQYALMNPNYTYDVPNRRDKVMVWVALIGDNTIIGPYFFNQNVNGASYLQMIDQFVVPKLVRRYGQGNHGSIPRLWWMQDGAPAHRAIVVRQRLQQLFPRRVVGIGHATEWPPRSPDLTPLDFFLWGHLKDKVYITVPPSTAVLEQRIRNEIQSMRRTRMVRKSVRSMADRAARCIAAQGQQIH